MKYIYLLFLLVCLHFCSFSQSDCGWSVTNTASNATLAILDDNFGDFTIWHNPLATNITLISNLTCPVVLGVFYTDDSGQLVCGGQTVWNNTGSMAISAWGDDPTTAEKDGFSGGESYNFKLCVDGVIYNANSITMSTENPFSDSYSTNAMGNILAMQFSHPDMLTPCNETIGILDEAQDKYLIKQVDMYGRNASLKKNTGFFINIYSDMTTSKVYSF